MEGFNIMDILNGTTTAAATVEAFKDVKLNYQSIIATKHNKYSMEEIGELATGIHMAGELQQPLVLGKIGEEYWLVSGHRRLEAIKMLVNEGEEEFAEIPCRYRDMTETEFRMQLLIGNTFNRKMTDYDRMTQAAEWKEVLQQAKKDGTFKPEKGTRTRDYIAQILGVAPATIGDLERINNNATDAVKEQLKEGNMKLTTAAEAEQASRRRSEQYCRSSGSRRGREKRRDQAVGERKERRRALQSNNGSNARNCVRYRHNRRREGKRKTTSRFKNA